jgi:GGDEF domain-containing protein
MTPHEDTLIAAHARVENALKAAWADGITKSSPLAALLVAFDGGDQAAGAEAVDTLERALRVHCGRQRDIVLRRKHNEFLALLPDTPPAGARQVGGQIVEAMRRGDNLITVSVGVAVAVPDEQRTPSDLIRRAESALRASRDNGGDRCTGGTAAGAAPSPPKGALAQLRDLLPGKKKDSDLKRRTD